MHLEDRDDDDEVDKPPKHSHRISKLLHLHVHSEHHHAEGDEELHRGRTGKGAASQIHDGTVSEPRPSMHSTEDTTANGSRQHSTVRSKASRPRRSSVSTARSTILGRLRSIRSSKTGSRRRSHSSDSASTHSTSSSASSDQAEPAYKDPSTHVNIMTNKHLTGDEVPANDKQQEKDLSHHTFFIENSQMRLKLVARTEVSASPSELSRGLTWLSVKLINGFRHSSE
jgi:phospholipase D1/2